MSHLVCLDFEQVHIFSQGLLHFKKSRFLLSLFIIIFFMSFSNISKIIIRYNIRFLFYNTIQ
jgi:hypothetical protein